mgnify:CR=1 FL=1
MSDERPFKWEKRGLIFAPDTTRPWSRSHAMCPTPLVLSDDRIRIFYSGLDENMAGRVGYIDVSTSDPQHILSNPDTPVLDIGKPGHFDDNGVVPISILRRKNKVYLYYAGFQQGLKIRYTIFSGLAIGNEDGSRFERYSEVPILDRADEGTLLRSAPCAVEDESGGFHMWYIVSNKFIPVGDKDIPTYPVHYTHSDDGINWPNKGKLVLDFANDDEFGFGRPHVILGSKGFHMWYSLRRKSIPYRLGYAHSNDGINWHRDDARIGIDVSETGWDSEMVYACSICQTKYGTYMFYNGNDHGRTGFGYARLDGDL